MTEQEALNNGVISFQNSIFFPHFLSQNGWKEGQFEVCCDISASDYISALCKAATACPEVMLPTLTRIDGMTFQLVHQQKITPWVHWETLEMLYIRVALLHFHQLGCISIQCLLSSVKKNIPYDEFFICKPDSK